MYFSIYYPEKSIAVTRYGFKIENTWITKMGNTITAQVCWTAPLNDGYFLFKSPSYHHWDKNRVVFLGFNRAHRGAAFYLSFNFKSENDAEDLKMDTVGDNIVHSISKDGIFVTCILNAKRKRLIDDNNGKTWINFKI